MSCRLAYDLTDAATGELHPLVLSGGMWHGDTMLFDFSIAACGLSGRVECNWRSSGPVYRLEQGEVTTDAQRQAVEQLTQILRPFFGGSFSGIREEQLAQLYSAGYYEGSGYSDKESPIERELKGAVAEHVATALGSRKVLDAGCAGGLLVHELRNRGVEAHGFDHSPDLDRIAVPEVASFLRQGSLTNIPYGPEDGFDTLVCIDVFEHVPEDRVPKMVEEFDRLGVQFLAVHISHTELEHVGHITLRPLSWWDEQLGSTFRRAQCVGEQLLALPVPYDPKRVLRIYRKIEAPVELRPRPPVATAAARSGGAVPAT
ncbi:MAG: class I SAM-dependent methyltransferase [Planctomycetota bacterium]